MKRALAVGVIGVALAAGAADEERAPLRFNPFAVPELSAEGTVAPTGPARSANEWEPVLRGTLVADEGSLADLGGVLLAVGESHHGWRLLEVREFEAVFDRNGERMVLGVQQSPAKGSD